MKNRIIRLFAKLRKLNNDSGLTPMPTWAEFRERSSIPISQSDVKGISEEFIAKSSKEDDELSYLLPLAIIAAAFIMSILTILP